MYQNRNITDFFKPFAARKTSTKRPTEFEELDSTIVVEHRRPKGPKGPKVPKVNVEFKGQSVPNVSSTDDSTSSLTSLGSDISIECQSPVGKSEIGTQTIETKTAIERLGSNGPILTSSQRITKNGEILITNSDDEWDSEDSLEDIDALLAVHRGPRKPSGFPEPNLPPSSSVFEPQRLEEARDGRSSRRTRSGRHPAVTSVEPRYKYSLSSLIAQAKRDDMAEASAAQACELVGSLDQQRASLEAKIGGTTQLDTTLLTAIVSNTGETDNLDRLMRAIARTEALQTQMTWPFFDLDLCAEVHEGPDFPSISDTKSRKFLSDPQDRYAAFVNGYLEEVAAKGKLPDHVLEWTIGALSVSVESSEQLRAAYTSTLMQAGDDLRPALNIHSIEKLFSSLGASKEALNTKEQVTPTLKLPPKSDVGVPDLIRLRDVLNFLVAAVPYMNSDTLNYVTCILFRLSLDTLGTASSTVSVSLEDALENVIGSIIEDRCDRGELVVCLKNALSTTVDAQLYLQLLRSIPATSPRLSLFRRRLALAFSCDDISYLRKEPPDLVDISVIIQHLQKPRFKIGNTTDYRALAATIAILDIGVDDADPPDPMLNSNLEDGFNRDIDKLADTIKGMFARITDTGASHITRTDAKDGLESFRCRLEFTVRTKPKLRKSLFGSTMSEDMAKFLGKNKKKPETALTAT